MGAPEQLANEGITGVQVAYYFICRTKLWLFSHQATMEQESDTVALGRLIHEGGYRRKKKEVRLGPITIDFVRRGEEVVLHEVKKSKKMEGSHEYQLLYYLYFLKHRGIKARGVINYPRLRRTKEVVLTPEREGEVEETLREIGRIVAREKAPGPEKKSYCRKCSYFEFCWVR